MYDCVKAKKLDISEIDYPKVRKAKRAQLKPGVKIAV